jgi:hypothetical protein
MRSLFLILFLTAVTYCGIPTTLYAETATDEQADSEQAPAAEDTKEQPKEPVQISGVYYGYIQEINPQRHFLFISPIDPALPRKMFFFDAKTIVTEDKIDKEFSVLKQGHKVAVLYFGQDDLFVAEQVFIVTGEFEPKEYRRVRRKKGKSK